MSGGRKRRRLGDRRLDVLRRGVDVRATRSNWSVICVEPRAFVEFIDVSPAMVENCRSSGVATDEAIVSGLAPGRFDADQEGREVDVREVARRERPVRADAEDDHGAA